MVFVVGGIGGGSNGGGHVNTTWEVQAASHFATMVNAVEALSGLYVVFSWKWRPHHVIIGKLQVGFKPMTLGIVPN